MFRRRGGSYFVVVLFVFYRVVDVGRVGDYVRAVDVVDGFVFRKSS